MNQFSPFRLNASILCNHIFFLLIMVCLFSTCAPTSKYAKLSETNKVELVSNVGEIERYLNHYAIDPIGIKAINVQKHNEKYYLLAKDEKDAWLYCIPLKQKGNALRPIQLKQVNACQTEVMSIDEFKIINENEIFCQGNSHLVFGR